MRRRLLTISAMRLGEIPTALARWFWERPYSARNSSLSISPGVTGANSSSVIPSPPCDRRCRASASVIVHDPHLMGLTIAPPEDDAPLLVYPDRIEAS